MKEKNSMPQDTIRKFEKTIAEYSGSQYAVSVDSCCNALFLCCKYQEISKSTIAVRIPKRTYPGVACAIINAGGRVRFHNEEWKGGYFLEPFNIYDGALRFRQGMYKKGFHCLSFHSKKHLPIGRGGMILTDNLEAYEWFKQARFDGRHESPLLNDSINMIGWNMYMSPEQAARGLVLFDIIKGKFLEDIDCKSQGYPDLSKIKAYKCIQ